MIGKKAPTFTTDAFHNDKITTINLADFQKKYTVLIFYPLDFTLVCPTELLAFSDQKEDFTRLNANVMYISRDSVYCHRAWAKIDRGDGGVNGVCWPMLSDISGNVSRSFNLLGDNDITMRATVILDKDLVVRFINVMDEKIGRSVAEVLRVLENIKFLDENKNVEFCPVDFQAGK